MPSSVDEIFAGLRAGGRTFNSFDQVLVGLRRLDATKAGLDATSIRSLTLDIKNLKKIPNLDQTSIKKYLVDMKNSGYTSVFLTRLQIFKNMDNYKSIFNDADFLKQLDLPSGTLDDVTSAAARQSGDAASAAANLRVALGSSDSVDNIIAQIDKLPKDVQIKMLDAVTNLTKKADDASGALAKKLQKSFENLTEAIESGGKKFRSMPSGAKKDLVKLAIVVAKFGAGYYMLDQVKKFLKKDQETEKNRVKCRAVCEPLYWEKAEAAGLGGTTALGDSSLGYRVLEEEDIEEGDELIDESIYEDSWDWDTQPLCPKDPPADCKTYCEDECDEAHPTQNPFRWLGGGLDGLLSALSEKLKDLIPDMPDIPGIDTGIHAIITGVLAFLFTIAFLYAMYRVASK